MAKQNEVDASNGIFHNRKERSPDTCYHIDESWKCYAKWKRPATKKKTHISMRIGWISHWGNAN